VLKEIINSTGKTKTDVHLKISYLDDNNNPDPDLDRVYDKVFEADLLNGATYNVNPPIGTFIYANAAIANEGYTPDPDKVRLSGYFTPQDVPGPLPILGIGAAFTISRKLRRRVKGE
jgi:hypothetical protein